MHNSSWLGKTLGVLGGGNMAEAIVRGVLAAGLVPAADIAVYDPLAARRELFAGLGCRAADAAREVAGADFLLLAVKPQTFREAVGGLGDGPGPGTVVASIIAGVPIRAIEALFPPGCRVVRVMPNTPLLIGRGVSALARGGNAGAADLAMARQLFACAGQAFEVEERHMDAVTALSGSGPAYLFRFAEALIAAGEKLGLAPELSRDLAVGTLRGAAEMLAANPDPALLRQRVTSPGGTTAAALRVFDEGDFAGLVAEALAAAERRGAELGKKA